MTNWLFRTLRKQRHQRPAHNRAREPRSRKARLECLEERVLLTAVHWVGGATGLWDQAANWSNDAVPTTADDVTINSGTATTVTIQSGDVESINSLTTAAGNTLAMTGGSLAIAANSVLAGNFNFSGGTLGGAGNVTFDATVNWTGGTMAGTGTTDIAAGATLNVSGNVVPAGGAGERRHGQLDERGHDLHVQRDDQQRRDRGRPTARRRSRRTAATPAGRSTPSTTTPPVRSRRRGRARRSSHPATPAWPSTTPAPSTSARARCSCIPAAPTARRSTSAHGAAADFFGNYTHAAGSSLNGPGSINFAATQTVAGAVTVSGILNFSSGTIAGAGGLTATGR